MSTSSSPSSIAELQARYGYCRSYAGCMLLLMAGGIVAGLANNFGLVLAALCVLAMVAAAQLHEPTPAKQPQQSSKMD